MEIQALLDQQLRLKLELRDMDVGRKCHFFNNYFLNLHFHIGRASGITYKHTTASATPFVSDGAFKNTYIPVY